MGFSFDILPKHKTNPSGMDRISVKIKISSVTPVPASRLPINFEKLSALEK